MNKERSRNPLRRTAKNSVIYGLGTALRQLTAFVMLPIYTQYLTPGDYGVVALLTIAIEIAGIIVGMRITEAMFRYYLLAEKDSEKNEVVSTVFLTILCTGTVGVIIIALAADFIGYVLIGSDAYTDELRLFSVTLLLNAILGLCFGYFRVRRKPVVFVLLNGVYLLLQIAANIVFVVIHELHVIGVVYSAVVSGSIMAISLGTYVVWNVGLHFSDVLVKRLYVFVKPLIFASLAGLYVAQVDKYFLRLFGDVSDVGIYVLAVKISGVLLTAYSAFNMSWGAERYEIYKSANAKELKQTVFRFLSAGVIILALALSLIANDLIEVMTNPAFYDAGNIVPLLVLAAVLRVFTLFCNFGIYLHEQTHHIATAMWIKAVVMTVFCVLLIPYIGISGAAITVIISNLVELIWVNKKSTGLYDMGLNWRPVLLMGFIAVVAISVGMLLPVGELAYFLIRVLIFIVALVLIYIMPSWSISDRKIIGYPIRAIATRLKITG